MMDNIELSDQKPFLVEIEIQGVANNVVIKNENPASMLDMNNEILIKQEPLEQDSVETSCNVYDAQFGVVKQELCDNNSAVEQGSDNNDHKELYGADASGNTNSSHTLDTPVPVELISNSIFIKQEATEEETVDDEDNKTDRFADEISNTSGACRKPKKLFYIENKLITCKICRFKCKFKSHFERHVKTHTGEKSIACTLCQFRCIRSSNLDAHMRTHTGEKPYSCNFCSYRCKQKSHLKKHIRSHTGERPYACDVCQYRSADKSKLVGHMRTHTGEKPFACELCVYKCAEKANLLSHMRTHTGEKLFACELCSYKCNARNRLLRHTRTHKGEKY